MNVGRVRQHDAAQVPRGRRGVDVSREAQLAQMRQRTAVVDVCVGKDDVVNGLRIEGKVLVPLDGVLPASLVEAAIEQDALAVDFEEVF